MESAAADFWDCNAEVLGTTEGISESDYGTGASTIVRRGKLPDMVAYAMALPADERANISIVRPGSAYIGGAEIEKLTARPDYPGPTPL